jgi:uncharacterized protein with HEPN domain
MLPHETKKYFFDIAEASDLILQFTAGKTLADYQNDPLLRSGVERQFEIIGEALNQAIQHDPNVAELISNSSRIISFRNRLIHGYATISDHVVWGVLETNLPVLNREVKVLLENAED